MMELIFLSNLVSVGIFGMVLSASFCDIAWIGKKRWIILSGMAFIILLQGVIYILADKNTVYYFYPLITHLPWVLLLCILTKQCLWACVSVLTAYLFCQLRRWLAMLIVLICSGNYVTQELVELLITLPLLWYLLKFIAPAVRSVSRYSFLEKCQFGAIPTIYYGYDYLTRIYIDMLFVDSSLIAEFMQFVCSVAYIVFALYISKEEKMRHRLQQTQESLRLQVSQAVLQIDSLRKSEQTARIYRHDLRHHVQYLSECIKNRKYKQAQDYIQEICSVIETNKEVVFCENEMINLIFSSFAGRAESDGIPMDIKAAISGKLSIAESDLCVLLSNALENALNACKELQEKGISGEVEVSAYEKNGQFLLEIVNSCIEDSVYFINGVPVTDSPGHGVGVRSICAIVERYKGIYDFSVKSGKFILRVALA